MHPAIKHLILTLATAGCWHNASSMDLHLFKSAASGGVTGISLRVVGNIETPSRKLTIIDPGWLVPQNITTAKVAAPNTNAAVEIAVITEGENRGMPAFLVLRYRAIQDALKMDLIEWASTPRGEKLGHVGVDSGEIAVIDAASIPSGQQEAMKYGDEIVSLADPSKGAVIDPKKRCFVVSKSGNGDGVYPCYWLRNSSEEIVALVIDFENWSPAKSP